MSGSVGLSTAPFSDAERVDMRRFMGYPTYGAGASGFQGWRFFQAYGTMEYRLTNMGPSEFQVCRQFLAQLYVLEAAVWGSSANLDVQQAAVYIHNPKEVQDREGLYRNLRMKLCAFVGLPAGDSLSASGQVTFVV